MTDPTVRAAIPLFHKRREKISGIFLFLNTIILYGKEHPSRGMAKANIIKYE